MPKTEVHVRPGGSRWVFEVNGVRFGEWPQCQALKLGLRTARALSRLPDVTAKVVVHEANGRVRSVLSFGDGLPLRLRRRGDAPQREVQVPLALAMRYARDVARASV